MKSVVGVVVTMFGLIGALFASMRLIGPDFRLSASNDWPNQAFFIGFLILALIGAFTAADYGKLQIKRFLSGLCAICGISAFLLLWMAMNASNMESIMFVGGVTFVFTIASLSGM